VARGILTLWRGSRKSGGKPQSSPPDTVVTVDHRGRIDLLVDRGGSSFKFGTLPTSIPSTHRHRKRTGITAVPPSKGAEDFTPLSLRRSIKTPPSPRTPFLRYFHHPFSECSPIPAASLDTLGASRSSATIHHQFIYIHHAHLHPSPARIYRLLVIGSRP